jgi:flagellar M-ring protein FliF
MLSVKDLERLWQSILGLGPRRLGLLAIIGLTTFAAVGFGTYYLNRADYETLYTGLTPQDSSRIGAALKEEGVGFDVSADGTKVLVQRGQSARARMLLAERGLPSSATAGYELFDKLGPIGLTSFMQEVTRVRVLEGELARTIQTMRGIKAARVHIVLPDGGSFRRNRQPPSASVVIKTEVVADTSAAAAIRHLVAAAIPGMALDQVSIMSTDGTVVAAEGGAANAQSDKIIDLERMISKNLQANIRKTLTPYLGAENFEISVAASLNIDKRQINETIYDPESKVERSLRVVKETGSSQNSGKNPTVSVEQNIPDDQGGAKQGGGDQSKKSNERREELTNFELNTKTISTASEGFKVDAINVAVVVNRKQLLAAIGPNPTPEAIDRQLKEIERLAGSAAGIDAKRGDRVTVAAVEFLQAAKAVEAAPGRSILEGLMQYVGTLINAAAILGATLLLVLLGLRPAVRGLIEASAPVEALAGPSEAVAIGAPELEGGLEPVTSIIASMPMEEPKPDDSGAAAAHDHAAARQQRLGQLVSINEEQAAAILKQWLRGV